METGEVSQVQLTCNAVTLDVVQRWTTKRIIFQALFSRFSSQILLSQWYPICFWIRLLLRVSEWSWNASFFFFFQSMHWLGQQTMYAPWDSVCRMGDNRKYKKIKVKKSKLKSKKAKVELLFAADKADFVVEEYTDQVYLLRCLYWSQCVPDDGLTKC